MKTMSKKLASIVLALCLCFSLVGTALAAEIQTYSSSTDTAFTITVTNAADGETYSAYKIFDVTYDDSKENYSYTIDSSSAWYSTVAAATNVFTLTQVNGTSTYNVTVNEGVTDDAIIAVFTNADIDLSEVSANATVVASGATVVLDVTNSGGPGYYYVTTSLGSLVIIDTTDPNPSIAEKNPTPTLTKGVEDVTAKDQESSYEEEDNADVVDTLQYEIIISDVNNIHNLCLHDVIDADMVLSAESITVYLNGDATTGQLVASTNYKLTVFDENNQNTEDDCCFEISFNDDFLDTLTSSDKLYIIYTVTIDQEADLEEGEFADDVHDFQNVAHLSYGNASYSVEAETDTYTYGFDIYKYTNGDEGAVALADATFVVKYIDSAETTHYATFNVDEDGQYVLSGWVDTIDSATTLVTPATGMIYVEGFDPDTTYYIEETAAPDGYNKLTGDVSVVFNVDDEDATSFTVTYIYNNVSTTDEDGHQVDILNQSGSELPGTGGMGTTIFYIIGGVLVAGAVVVLITRRRMSSNEG